MTPNDTFTPSDLLMLPDKGALLASFKGFTVHDLRTPAAVVDRAILRRNAERVMRETEARGMAFRAHVKTHKTAEATRLQITAGQGTSRVITSTLPEIYHLIRSGLVDEGLITDILYSMPVGLDKIADLDKAQATVGNLATVRVMVDHPAQVRALEEYNGRSWRDMAWEVFVKVDGGGRRAGAPPESPQMKSLIQAIIASPAVEIHGFYSHFGHSYDSKDLSDAAEYFDAEVQCANAAAKFARSLGATGDWVLSVGATPTAHAAAAQGPSATSLNLEGSLELSASLSCDGTFADRRHAGNYCICDLQQYSTSLVPPENLALAVISRVVSVYPERMEALCDCGGLAVSKDRGPIAGHGDVVGENGSAWYLARVSQEHGILRLKSTREGLRGLPSASGSADGGEDELEGLRIGDLVRIIPQHACLVFASHPWIYVVDGGEEIVDVWVPWKGW